MPNKNFHPKAKPCIASSIFAPIQVTQQIPDHTGNSREKTEKDFTGAEKIE